MGSKSKIAKMAIFSALLLLMELSGRCDGKTDKRKPTLDLEDYIDTGKDKVNEELSTSATGHYHHGHLPVYSHHHHGAYGDHHHHPVDYGHAHSYFAGEYGGFGHVGSAHVSYGTEINHGHGHGHFHGYHG